MIQKFFETLFIILFSIFITTVSEQILGYFQNHRVLFAGLLCFTTYCLYNIVYTCIWTMTARPAVISDKTLDSSSELLQDNEKEKDNDRN